MTEEEAKTKLCPLFAISKAIIYQSNDSEPGELDCIGSECMMWRKTYRADNVNYETVLGIVTAIEDGGYCGLAGKP